jgi:glycosyltransferase involved in cell wall biosynthesis
MSGPELSLVIPCHNEEKNLQPLLAAIHATLDPLSLDYEIVEGSDTNSPNRVIEMSAVELNVGCRAFRSASPIWRRDGIKVKGVGFFELKR